MGLVCCVSLPWSRWGFWQLLVLEKIPEGRVPGAFSTSRPGQATAVYPVERRHPFHRRMAVVVVMLVPVVWVVYQVNRTVYSDAELARLNIVLDATGPLTLAEVQANLIDRMEDRLNKERRECVFREVAERARAAGDPEVLDPSTIEMLPTESWNQLDPFGRRVFLAQAITTKAFYACK